MTRAISFLFGRFTFLPCQRLLCIVKASMVTVRCFVWTCEKHFPPELYLKFKCFIKKIVFITKMKMLENFARDLLEKFVEHFIYNLFRSSSVQFTDFISVWAVWIESSKLKACISKEDKEVFTFWSRNCIQHSSFWFVINRSWEYTVFNSIQHYTSIWLCYWLLI